MRGLKITTRALYAVPRVCAYAYFPKNAEISANTLKMRIGCVIYYFTPRRARELSNKEIRR